MPALKDKHTHDRNQHTKPHVPPPLPPPLLSVCVCEGGQAAQQPVCHYRSNQLQPTAPTPHPPLIALLVTASRHSHKRLTRRQQREGGHNE
mmetsp:Transcript_25327/g.62708  ORF Transcript_25327/g.62708 Transcript_25327/m.62708 type:complete len:91 (-) Transcript_25327:64-336(-)